jgi:hypothetical protein
MRRKQGRAVKHRKPFRISAFLHAWWESRPQARTDHTEDEVSAWQRETGYRPSVNQARHEPMPASHHAPRGQEAEVRSAQHAAGKVQAWPSRNARPQGQCGESGPADGSRAG